MPRYVFDFPPVEKSKILHIDDLAFSGSKITVEMAAVSEYVYSSIFMGFFDQNRANIHGPLCF
jgi:hypothetical protein